MKLNGGGKLCNSFQNAKKITPKWCDLTQDAIVVFISPPNGKSWKKCLRCKKNFHSPVEGRLSQKHYLIDGIHHAIHDQAKDEMVEKLSTIVLKLLQMFQSFVFILCLDSALK